MNKREYKQYQKAFSDFFEREKLDTFSPIEQESEPYFSWRPCEVCNSPLGGDRQDYHGSNCETNEIVGPYSVCSDCVYYNEYGTLDDQTMLEIDYNEDLILHNEGNCNSYCLACQRGKL